MAEPSRARRLLAAELKALRTMRGLSQHAVGNLPQARVWRIEHPDEAPRTVPTRGDVEAWLAITNATNEQQERVLVLLEAAHNETRPWAELAGDDQHLQGGAGDRDQEARLVRLYQPVMVPGLLQTAEYARLVLEQTDPAGERDLASALRGRIDRQQVLYEPGHGFEFLLAEAALRWSPGAGVMAAQLDRLVSLATLASVELRVLPDRRMGVPGWHGFVWRQPSGEGEAPYVTAELVHGGPTVTEPGLVKLYELVWDQLWAAAVVGDEAVALIRGAARG